MAAWLSLLCCLWSVSPSAPSFTASLIPSSLSMFLSACLFFSPQLPSPALWMAPPCLFTQPLSSRQHIMTSEPDVRQGLAGSHRHCCCCCCCWAGRGARFLVPQQWPPARPLPQPQPALEGTVLRGCLACTWSCRLLAFSFSSLDPQLPLLPGPESGSHSVRCWLCGIGQDTQLL